MSYDGVAEETAIRARLATLAGGRVLDMTPDDDEVPIDSAGKTRPYIVLSVGVPTPVSRERSYGDGEKDIPYLLTFVVGCFAGNRDALNALYPSTLALLLDWIPVDKNDGAVSLQGAAPSSSRATPTRPAIFGKIAALKVTINLSTH